MHRSLALVVGLGLAVLAGCAPSYGHHGHVHSGGISAGGAVALGILAGAAVVALSEPPPQETVVYYGPPPPPVVISPTPEPHPARPERDYKVPDFDAATTRSALSNADVSGCGAPKGYGHARVTVNPDGVVSKVVVEEPSGLAPEVAQCIGEKIGRVKVPAFYGNMVVVGTTFRTP